MCKIVKESSGHDQAPLDGSTQGSSGSNKNILTFATVSKVAIAPDIAWPTVILCISCWIVRYVILRAYQSNNISTISAVILCIITAFASFTPMHEAAHGNVATIKGGHKWLNLAVGVISGWNFPIPCIGFQLLHLKHHKYTNDSLNDPDHWSGSGSWFLLPLRWLTQEIIYYIIAVPQLVAKRSLALIDLIAMIAAVVVLSLMGFGQEVLWLWIIPGRLSIAVLAFAFDYLPHRNQHDKSLSMYKATHVTSLIGDVVAPLTVPLLYQNYHNIHHLAPYIPFYKYKAVWEHYKTELLSHGSMVVPIIGHEKSH
jgi:beta-carotene hydroxylase